MGQPVPSPRSLRVCLPLDGWPRGTYGREKPVEPQMIRFLFRLVVLLVLLAVAALIVFRVLAANRESVAAADLLLPQSRMVETVHGALHVLEAGPEDGQPILLIHGSVGWAGLWRETSQTLSDLGYRVVAVDLPPMGLSDRIDGMDYSRQAQGLRVLALAESLATPPIVVAHSFGAGAAVEAMMAGPEAFRGGVIVAGALNLGQDGSGMSLPLPLRPAVLREAGLSATVTNPLVTKPLFQRFVHRNDSITSDVVGLLEYPFARSGTTEALAAWLPTLLIPPRGAASTDPARYADIQVPVALIWGREDTVTPPEQGLALQNALNSASMFWMDNIGHIPQIEAPDDFHQNLADALAGIEQG